MDITVSSVRGRCRPARGHQTEEANERLGLSADAAVGRALVDALASSPNRAGSPAISSSVLSVASSRSTASPSRQCAGSCPTRRRGRPSGREDLAVVDLADLRCGRRSRPTGGRSRPRAAAPRVAERRAAGSRARRRLGAVQEFQFADQVVVQQLGEFAQRRVVAPGARPSIVRRRLDAIAIGPGTVARVADSTRREGAPQSRDGRQDRASPSRRGLACAREVDEACATSGERGSGDPWDIERGVNAWDLARILLDTDAARRGPTGWRR